MKGGDGHTWRKEEPPCGGGAKPQVMVEESPPVAGGGGGGGVALATSCPSGRSSCPNVQIATLLARSNLLITRDIEWANLALGFEQENRYAIMDVCYPQSLLRLRRPFVASITDANVTATKFHTFSVACRSEQFAVVENPGFWYWTFTLKDINGNVLAEIDRNWRGFGFEILTDAGQYVIRFGSSNSSSNTGLASEIQELEVARPLTLSERAVTLALAISLDNDYFSRHGGCIALSFVGYVHENSDPRLSQVLKQDDVSLDMEAYD
ncbi:unnamed protein product [Rhodiola kirilowii]